MPSIHVLDVLNKSPIMDLPPSILDTLKNVRSLARLLFICGIISIGCCALQTYWITPQLSELLKSKGAFDEDGMIIAQKVSEVMADMAWVSMLNVGLSLIPLVFVVLFVVLFYRLAKNHYVFQDKQTIWNPVLLALILTGEIIASLVLGTIIAYMKSPDVSVGLGWVIYGLEVILWGVVPLLFIRNAQTSLPPNEERRFSLSSILVTAWVLLCCGVALNIINIFFYRSFMDKEEKMFVLDPLWWCFFYLAVPMAAGILAYRQQDTIDDMLKATAPVETLQPLDDEDEDSDFGDIQDPEKPL